MPMQIRNIMSMITTTAMSTLSKETQETIKVLGLQPKDLLSQGAFGQCYLQGGTVVKVRMKGPSLQQEAELQGLCSLFGGAPAVLDYSENFIRMERVKGVELYQVLKEGHLTKLVRTSQEAAKALARVHKAGLVHRDIHPRNVLIRPDGSAVVIDYGMAQYEYREKYQRAELTGFMQGSSHPKRKGKKLYLGLEHWLAAKAPASRLYELSEKILASYDSV